MANPVPFQKCSPYWDCFTKNSALIHVRSINHITSGYHRYWQSRCVFRDGIKEAWRYFEESVVVWRTERGVSYAAVTDQAGDGLYSFPATECQPTVEWGQSMRPLISSGTTPGKPKAPAEQEESCYEGELPKKRAG